MSNASTFSNLNSNKVVVAIDFGTTFSGVGWALINQSGARRNICRWPMSQNSRDGYRAEKVPTQLRYTESGGSQWGFQITDEVPETEILKWFKLDLDPSIKISGQETVMDGRFRSKDPQMTVADYLRGIGEHLIYTLKTSMGKSFLKDRILEFVLTVPAMWTELATQRTIEACKQAGEPFTNARIHVVSEPEAAAMYTIASLAPDALKVGDSFVVCDAGGGTVDLISYTIAKLHPVLELKEATAGHGALCGSIFLDRGFETYLTRLLGDEPEFDTDAMKEALRTFETQIKQGFCMDTMPDNFAIPFKGTIHQTSLQHRPGRLLLKGAEIANIFEPVISKIIQLVKQQITESNIATRAVFLVGGFGSSTYLRERMQQSLPETEIIQPENSLLAVVYGAVMRGLEICDPERLTLIKVRDRVARKHYGVNLSDPYSPIRDSDCEDHKYWSGFEGSYRINLMHWLINKGDTLSEDQPFTESIISRRLVSKGRFGTQDLQIYADDSGRNAPKRKDDAVKELCKVTMDLSHIPLRDLTQKLGKDGLFYYMIEFDLEWVYRSQSTEFTLIHNGKSSLHLFLSIREYY